MIFEIKNERNRIKSAFWECEKSVSNPNANTNDTTANTQSQISQCQATKPNGSLAKTTRIPREPRVNRVLTKCSQIAHKWLTKCLQIVHKLLTHCSQIACKLLTNCSQVAHKLLTDCSQIAHKLLPSPHKLLTNCRKLSDL